MCWIIARVISRNLKWGGCGQMLGEGGGVNMREAEIYIKNIE